ncbi:histone deacetylase [Nocardioides sp.]|uniref:histone deacetylase n=1 Tax=Nocardioides sp. TaxID=35761 RepID=UPI0035296DBF
MAGLAGGRLRHRPDDRRRRRGEHHLTAPSDAIGHDELVWYAAYGSNLLAGRFTCYLEGGRPPGAARTYVGCRDTRPWRASRPVAIPGQLCFGGLSPTWGGGLAFLTHPAAGEARGRGYLVTAGQLADLARQEARVGPEHRLTLTPAGGRWHDVVPAYESVLGLGELDGHPAFTLTTAGSLAAAPPAPAYVRTILAGLVETYGGTPAEHADYLLAAPGVAAGWSGSTLTALIDP